MFPSTDNSHVAESLWRQADSWEASDRPPVPGDAARASTPAAAPGWRGAAGRALGLARAFLTLDDPDLAARAAGAPHARVEPPAHPHRQPLRPVLRSRRPGAAAPRPQPCLTPVARRPARVPGWQPR